MEVHSAEPSDSNIHMKLALGLEVALPLSVEQYICKLDVSAAFGYIVDTLAQSVPKFSKFLQTFGCSSQRLELGLIGPMALAFSSPYSHKDSIR